MLFALCAVIAFRSSTCHAGKVLLSLWTSKKIKCVFKENRNYWNTRNFDICKKNWHSISTNFFPSITGYECRRTSVPVDTAPPCVLADAGRCQNGGTLTYEAQQCWCLCPFAWQGNWDCSLPTGDPNAVTIGGNICKLFGSFFLSL